MGQSDFRLEQKQVSEFLERIKSLEAQNALVFADRENYLLTLQWLGITPVHAREIVLNLTVDDYVSGVGCEVENDGEECLIFYVDVGDRQLYIKLVIDESHSKAICMSFHIAKWPMKPRFNQGGDCE